MKPEHFLASHPVFTRNELAASLGGRVASTIGSHLDRWRRQGRIVRVKRGVFVRVDPGAHSNGPTVDLIAVASRLAPDAAIAYHTALEVHGHAQSVFERLTFVTWTKASQVTFEGRRFVPVRPRAPLGVDGRGERWIERAERSGTEIRVTTLERSLVDVLDRPRLAGGLDEVWRSLQTIPAVDPGALEEYVITLGSRTLAVKVGFFLESRREELAVPERLLDRLGEFAPRSPVYMDNNRRGRLQSRWRLVVPVELLPDVAGGTR